MKIKKMTREEEFEKSLAKIKGIPPAIANEILLSYITGESGSLLMKLKSKKPAKGWLKEVCRLLRDNGESLDKINDYQPGSEGFFLNTGYPFLF